MKPETREKVTRTLERYARGEYLSAAMKAEKIGRSTYYAAFKDDTELWYERALADAQLTDHLHEQQARDEGRLATESDVGAVRAIETRIRSRQWRMARLDRARFGDKQQVDLTAQRAEGGTLIDRIHASRALGADRATVRIRDYTGLDFDPKTGELIGRKVKRGTQQPVVDTAFVPEPAEPKLLPATFRVEL